MTAMLPQDVIKKLIIIKLSKVDFMINSDMFQYTFMLPLLRISYCVVELR